ncbi:MAG: carboxypeptidase-like regulatory domain-containing protein [Prevotella sp.]|nr:carboxypeptidase-like regulatory domain-containing protein [Prevotella sp.]
MKRIAAILLLALLAAGVSAQKIVLSGIVVDDKTGERIAQANVAAGRTGIAVVTNDDGRFTLKADDLPDGITVTHIGYQSQRLSAAQAQASPLTIRLKPGSVQLQEVVVWTTDPRELVNIAIRKIPENYSRQAELYNCFYRETAMKRQHFIYVAEGVVDMYKTAYNRDAGRDRVAIRKGRRLLSPKQNDTLTVKVMGGPVQPVQLDIAKNLDFLLNPEDLNCYSFAMEMPDMIDGRMQFVVSITPNASMPWALYYGRLFIDRETLAFTRAELTLDMSSSEKATRYMLVSKPAGVRFKPKEMSCLIDYRYEDGVTRISYIRSTFRFNCDWKRRLLATSFTAFCEMVVTDKTREDVRPISGRSSFDSRDAFFDKVDYFRDPDFWRDYNIIEPTETLDKAIDKLIKKYH